MSAKVRQQKSAISSTTTCEPTCTRSALSAETGSRGSCQLDALCPTGAAWMLRAHTVVTISTMTSTKKIHQRGAEAASITRAYRAYSAAGTSFGGPVTVGNTCRQRCALLGLRDKIVRRCVLLFKEHQKHVRKKYRGRDVYISAWVFELPDTFARSGPCLATKAPISHLQRVGATRVTAKP